MPRFRLILFFPLCFFFVVVCLFLLLYIPCWPRTHCVFNAGFKLFICLSWPPNCWDYRHGPPCSVNILNNYIEFLFYFLPLALIIYYISPKKLKNFSLFVTGVIFYAWGEPIYVLVMLLSIVIDYTAGRMMQRFDDTKKRRICLFPLIPISRWWLGRRWLQEYISSTMCGVCNGRGTLTMKWQP